MKTRWVLGTVGLLLAALADGWAQTPPDTLVSPRIRVVNLETPVPQTTRQIPDGIAKTSVILINNVPRSVLMEYSRDTKTWQKEQIQVGETEIYRLGDQKFYVRLYTTPQRVQRYSLVRGKRYQLYWSAGRQLIDLDPVE